MNLLLLEPGELAPDGTASLRGRRHQHAKEVLRAQAGQTLRVGMRGGLTGTATVTATSDDALDLEVHLGEPPPPRAGIDLVLAIPRPKALKRVVPAIASLGVDRVVLVNAARVEKSYFDSKVLARDFLAGLIDLGLEQARDTVAPVIEVRERLKPFVEDELDGWAQGGHRLLPHPTAARALGPVAPHERVVLAIGPDGGWVPYEVELFERAGFSAVTLGPRVLRVEVAVPTVIGALRARCP
jgi:RsmE family RNA methyltransferase